MGKSVRYKLHKSSGKKRKRRKVVNKGRGRKKNFSLSKPLKFFLMFLAISILGYWFFVAYSTIRDIKIDDIVGESEILDLVEPQKVRRTLVVYEDPLNSEEENLFLLAIVHNTDTSESLIYHLPGDLYVSDYFSNKNISVRDLTYAGNSYMYDEKYAYVIRQVEEQMAIQFDSYVWFGSKVGKTFVSDVQGWGNSEDDILQIFSKLSLFNLIPKYRQAFLFEDYFHSNMSFLEMYAYFQNIQGIVSSDNHEYVNLKEEASFERTLGSGRHVKVLDKRGVDISLRENIDILRTRELSREHVKVEVYNGSGKAGYASTIARRVFNAGCRVIRFENSFREYEYTKIYVSDLERFSNGLSVVESIVEGAEIIEGRPDFLTTGDIIIVLGLDE